MVNSLIFRIAQICRENLLAEKWLLAPSLRIGHQWLEQVTCSGQPIINVRLKTAMHIAYDSIESDPAYESGKAIDAPGGPMIIQQIWATMPKKETNYLSPLAPTFPLFQKLFATIEALRLSNISSDELHNDHFETPGKGMDIRLLLSEYERYLKQKRLFDRAEILKKAISVIEQNQIALLPDTLLLIPEELELSVLEKQLIHRLAGDRCITLPAASIIGQNNEPRTDLDLLRFIQNPGDAPAPFQDGSASLYSSIGEINEIREVFRRCKRDRIPLDTVELLYTDASAYLPQIYETGVSIFSTDQTRTLPITFADGIPVRYSRPGRLLQCGVEWIRSDYSQIRLIRMLEDGLLDHPQFESPNFGSDSLIQTLRSMVIGAGRERYAAKIRQEIAARKKQLNDSFSLYELQENMELEDLHPLQKEINELETALAVVADWLASFPAPNTHSTGQIDAFYTLLTVYSPCSTELDRNARQRILDELESMRDWIQNGEDCGELDILDWLSEIPNQLAVLGSSPRPGRLHAAGIHTGGHSGRSHTFLVGFDDGRFPGSGLQDPFLLDCERERISPDLPTASSRQRQTLDRFYQLLGRIQGQLVLSYSCYDPMDDRELFPSPAILAIYRILSGNREGDPSSLAEWLFPPASFCPRESGKALCESELWITRMTQQACGCNPMIDVEQRYPHIRQGVLAKRARFSNEFTPYDGWVPESGKDLDPTLPQGIVMSASRFETLGQCPLRFFFENGLKLEAPEEIGVDPDRWLDPMQFGSLMHEVFETFIQELIDQKQQPNYADHWPRLNQILDRLAEKYRDYIPPPNQSAFMRQYRDLQQCAHIFLRDEENLCQSHTPVYVETAIGIPSRGSMKSVSARPLLIPLPDGATFRARGIIDRVDRIGEEREQQYAIWDYKSGSAYKYDPNDPFRQGRVIQHSLYYELMTCWLKDHVSPRATLRTFGYFFPSEKGKGERITWPESELTRRANLFQSLCQLITHGIFAPTNEVADCSFCQYQPICQDVVSVTRASDEKLRNPMNARLQPFKELRNDE